MSVLMFHSIGNESAHWYRNWLSVSTKHFETFCEFLVKNGYETILLEDWYNNTSNSENNESKNVVLTFDDGYLDNWVFAYPILRKYGLKATIFINPEFVDPSEDIRYNLEDVWNSKIERDELTTLGFLNWAEIQKLDASGVMDIQSHSMSHNFYFHSNKIKDIYNDQPNYDWLAWFHEPKRKPFSITENQNSFVPNGYPIFEYGRALGLRRYFPDKELVDYAVENFSDDEYKDSFIRQLNEKIKKYPGYYETDEEMMNRYRYELFESKKILEKKLNKNVEFLCWPGGGYNDLSIELSIEAGYKASTIASRDRNLVIDNSYDYKRIRRFGMGSFISTPKKNHLVKRPDYLVSTFKAFNGNVFYRNFNRAHKLKWMIWDSVVN